MRKRLLPFTVFINFFFYASAQKDSLPLRKWVNNADTPLIFYISGDGGFNSFSTSLCQALYRKNYVITALNARSYFWTKKSPYQAASDISSYLKNQFAGRKNQQLILIGYSFGADVLPFIVNILPSDIQNKITGLFLLEPSETTDFEVHVWDMLGKSKKRGMDVLAETNKLTSDKVVIISASDTDTFPVEKVTLKKFAYEVLPGGHHFEGNIKEVSSAIMKHIM